MRWWKNWGCLEKGDVLKDLIEGAFGFIGDFFGIEHRCAMCELDYPRFFKVSDEEWCKVVPLDLQKRILCFPCYQKLALSKGIKIDMNSFRYLTSR